MSARWRMLVLAFLSQNLAIGITFGSYGLMIGDIAEDFAASRSQVSFGIALITLSMGLVSPLLGRLLDRWSIRNTMVLGALMAAVGFQLASRVESLPLFLASFGLVVGIGVTAMGVLPASKLAANWFPESTGKALGFVSLPLLIAVGPPLFGSVIADAGWRALFVNFSYAYVGLIPLLLLIKDKPPVAASAAIAPASDTAAIALLDTRLWALVLMGGVMFSGGIVLVTHIVQHAVGQGMALTHASWLLSVNGVASLIGAMLFGWLCDRLTPIRAITINVAIQAVTWLLVIQQQTAPGIIACVALLGLCGGGAHPALSALAGRVFGLERLGTALGQIALLVIPFNFGAAPLAGLLFDLQGNYLTAFALHTVLCTLATLILVWRGRRLETENPLPVATTASPLH